MQQAGVADGKADALAYLARMARPLLFDPSHPHLGLTRWEFELFEALYDNADTSFRALERWGWSWSRMPSSRLSHASARGQRAAGPRVVPHNPDGTRGDGESFIAALAALVAQRQIPVHVEHRVGGVIVDRPVASSRARITRTARSPRGPQGVVFCSGGFISQRGNGRYYMGGRVVGGCRR